MATQKFLEICKSIQNLPYGRNANRHDFSLVEKEGKGSCSSKHAFLKQVADKMGEKGVQLILGMYRMNEQNTPKIGSELTSSGLTYLPEAHCYLRIQGRNFDFTSRHAVFSSIEKDILQEREISPEQVVHFKIEYHQQFLKDWIETEKIDLSFKEIWQLREKCIGNMSQK